MSMIQPRPMPPFPKEVPDRRRKFWRQPMRRARLKQRSAKKSHWQGLYILALKFLIRLDPLCRRCRRRHATEGHHPWGQIGALILLFFPICRICHEEVEGNKRQARAEGWILY